MPPEDTPSLLPEGARFDHIGYACRDLDAATADLTQLGYAVLGETFSDPVQGVTGRFLHGSGPCLELLAPLPGSTVLDPWLAGSARMYHLGYEVPDIDATVTDLRDAGARVLAAPVPAVAFAGRRICFAMLRGPRLLIELIEMVDPDELPQ